MGLKLEGKIAAITGGSGGIGFSIAKAFMREGASVADGVGGDDGRARAQRKLRKALR